MFLAYVVFRDAKLRDFGKVIRTRQDAGHRDDACRRRPKAFAYMMTELLSRR